MYLWWCVLLMIYSYIGQTGMGITSSSRPFLIKYRCRQCISLSWIHPSLFLLSLIQAVSACLKINIFIVTLTCTMITRIIHNMIKSNIIVELQWTRYFFIKKSSVIYMFKSVKVLKLVLCSSLLHSFMTQLTIKTCPAKLSHEGSTIWKKCLRKLLIFSLV